MQFPNYLLQEEGTFNCFKLIDIIALQIEINGKTLYPYALKNNGQSCQLLPVK